MKKKVAKNVEKNTIFFQKNDKNFCLLFREIERVCEGLAYISETDAPVMPFSGQPADSLPATIIRQQTGASADEPISELSFSDFFRRLTTIKDWFGKREMTRAKQFLELEQLFEDNLSELKVFKVGRIQVEIFVVGIDKGGRLLGVMTRAVET